MPRAGGSSPGAGAGAPSERSLAPRLLDVLDAHADEGLAVQIRIEGAAREELADHLGQRLATARRPRRFGPVFFGAPQVEQEVERTRLVSPDCRVVQVARHR